MNEGVFLSALHENPSDELTWLALADWLEENDELSRAELLRCLRQLRNITVMRRTKLRGQLEDRVVELLMAGTRPVVAEITNRIGIRLALIPPGVFRMGSPRSEQDRNGNEPAHEVTLTDSFYLGVYPITQAQYESVMGNNPSRFSQHGRDTNVLVGLDVGKLPVETVSWSAAVEFCQRLTAHEQAARPGWVYRLPSEAEWEYACRGGSASITPFYLGSRLSSQFANFNGNRPYKAETGPHLGRTCPVGQYLPNVFGLYDMMGNVWEWCDGWYTDYPTGPVTNPVALTGSERVCRGGSWRDPGYYCRSADRFQIWAENHDDYLGFRVALVRGDS